MAAKKGKGGKTALTTKQVTRPTMMACKECDNQVVEMERVKVIGARTRSTWRCKSAGHMVD